MAKDPAFLFYPGDWMGGTMILNRHQKGCYIDLLIAQFNNGPLSLETIKTILGTDQASWTALSKKFKQDSEGNYFNERLAAEIEKRKKFIDHQSENGRKGGRPKKLEETRGFNLVKPKTNPLENENENKDEKIIEKQNHVFEKSYDFDIFLKNQKWKEQFCMTKYISMQELERLQNDFVADIRLKGEFIDNLYRYFTHWFNKNIPLKNLNAPSDLSSKGRNFKMSLEEKQLQKQIEINEQYKKRIS